MDCDHCGTHLPPATARCPVCKKPPVGRPRRAPASPAIARAPDAGWKAGLDLVAGGVMFVLVLAVVAFVVI